MKKIKQLIHRIKYRAFCKLSRRVTLDSKDIFEGDNYLAEGVTFLNSSMGRSSYIGENSFVKNAKIGRYCSIGNEVMTVTGNHPIDMISTHPAFYSTQTQTGKTFVGESRFEEFDYIDKTSRISVRIGNDVWIGARVTILEHVTIGDGAVIAAGSVVTNDIPPYAVVAGVPAKVIKYRFEENRIKELLELEWWNKDDAWIKENLVCHE